ncbi:hypothetical protein MKW98_003388 [Papaver atlanticum]|uniref:Pyruvate kinase n=1 Tax=Papaver atlanticum TaxID=357466 RepID=A0AAD4XTI4_9MAGN|nr:hypothetical protein MKW98_003388 [Papaver atlanticum]
MRNTFEVYVSFAAKILKQAMETALRDPEFSGILILRSNVDLKDKWRNIQAPRSFSSADRPDTLYSLMPPDLSRARVWFNTIKFKVFLFQKAAVYKCNMAGKPAVVTRVVDSMTDNLRPTRAEATDVANAVLDGTDAILLGAETLRGFYPVETNSIVGKICAEAEKVFNRDLFFKKTVKYVGEPMSHLESIASSAAVAGFVFDRACLFILIAKYRPTMPVLSVVIPRLKTNQLRWSFTGAFEARQSLIVRGLFPMLADPRHPAESTNSTNESVLKVALDHGKASGVIKSHDRVVVCQKVGDSSVVKIIELED